MANNYYNATGVLILDRVTPVIAALFGGFNLDPTFPGDGKAYISEIADTNDPVWEEVQEYLIGLADDLGVPLPVEEYPPFATVLRTLAGHFRADHHAGLAHLIEHHDFTGYADLEDLFLIATCFDDGHGLTAIAFEGCWHGEKPRLFEFGGNGCFISRQVTLHRKSTDALQLGDKIQQALIEGDLDSASAVIAGETKQMLSAVADPIARETLLMRVSERLSQESDAGNAG